MTNPTDTNQASELFELCREVYERTRWKDTLGYIQPFGQNVHFPNWFDDTITEDHDIAPLYTSDYLLEKLPIHIYLQHHANNTWKASQLQPTELRTAENAYQSINSSGDTPLKALLKLTIALSEAGKLK